MYSSRSRHWCSGSSLGKMSVCDAAQGAVLLSFKELLILNLGQQFCFVSVSQITALFVPACSRCVSTRAAGQKTLEGKEVMESWLITFSYRIYLQNWWASCVNSHTPIKFCVPLWLLPLMLTHHGQDFNTCPSLSGSHFGICDSLINYKCTW